MRWLDSIINSTDMRLNKLWEIVKKREESEVSPRYSCEKNPLGPWVRDGFKEQTLEADRQGKLCRVSQSRLPLCDPRDCSTPGFPVLHRLPEFAQTHVH